MVEPGTKDHNKTADLEDTVRNLREENAKLLQLLRSQGLLIDASTNQNGKSSDTIFPISNQQKDSSSITFNHSDLTLTTNSLSTTNQTNHQHINNHGSINQQSFNGQTVHGNQSNITPNFNTVIQTTSQPFVQNSSNTLVQNNTNLIQPINLVNFNNVSLDSIQSFFASQNNLVYLSQTSSSSTTTTTAAAATTTATSSANSITPNTNLDELLPSNTHSILPSSSLSSEQQNQIVVRPKLTLLHKHQELVPVIPKIRPEHYESITRQFSSSSSNDASNLFDNDSNDSKNRYPRLIRSKTSSRTSSLKVSSSVAATAKRKSIVKNAFSSSKSFATNNKNSATVSLLSPSSSKNYLSKSSILDHERDLRPHLDHSRSLDLSIPSTKSSLLTSLPTIANKKSSKTRICNRKKTSGSTAIVPSHSPSLLPIVPNIGRLLAPVIVNIQRGATSKNRISKRSTTNKKQNKRNSSKTPVQYHSESILQQNPSSPMNLFAESISGLLENLDQELLASNFLLHTSSNDLLLDENNSITSSNTNVMQTSDHIDLRHIGNTNIQHQETYHSATSMPTLDEFNNQLENDTILITQSRNGLHTVHGYNVENEHITSFMSEEDMRFVEMNFDENIFLKQFDLEDPGIKQSVHSDQNLFASILTNNNHNNNNNNNDLSQIQQSQINEQSENHQNQSLPHPAYPGSSLMNNNIFTTVVQLGSQRQALKLNAFNNNNNNNSDSTISLLPEEGFQLTARHIEPSQVATYETVKYQDILDDLVMVTDQDALQHAQATAASDPSIDSTDFSLELLEAANEIMKNTNIQIVEENSSTFTELQYFYPIEQEQANLEKQLKTNQSIEKNLPHDDQQSIVILENLQSEIMTSTSLIQNNLEKSITNTSINDLSFMLEFDQAHSPITDHDRSTTNLITPIRPTKNISHLLSLNSPPPPPPPPLIITTTTNNNNNDINIDSHLILSNTFDNNPTISYSPISDTLAISSNSLQQQLQTIEPLTISSNSLQQQLQTIEPLTKSSITFDSKSLPSNPSSPLKCSYQEMIIDSGRLDESNYDKFNYLNNNDYAIEELLRDTTDNPYEIMENQGQTFVRNLESVDNFDELIEQIEISQATNPKRVQSFEDLFSRYQEKHYLKLKHEQNLSSRKFKQQPIISTVELKLFSEQISIKENEPNSPLSSKITDQESIEHPALNIKIQTKEPSPISVEDKIQDKKIRKAKKQKSHHHHHHHHQKRKSTNEQSECAGTTSVEQPLLQLYSQPSPLTPAETIAKDEISTSPLPATQQSELESLSTNIHSGFMINEQTPPSSITSMGHKQSPPPLLINQTKTEKLNMNYSHLFNYDNNNNNNNNTDNNTNDHQNNNTFITPPPESDNNISQQKSNTYENFSQFSNSPNKKKRHHRKSSVTSSTSSKSLNNLDYALDTQELEPVSPTPLPTSKKHHSQNHSSSNYNHSSPNNNGSSPPYYEQHQQKHTKDYYSRKSSSNRSSRIASSQMHPQSRSISNHSYRTSQEPSLISPTLPVAPPPIHMDPYAQPYHSFVPRAGPPPFFNFPFPHPFLNPHPTTSTAHFHPHALKYHDRHHHPLHPSHVYPTHSQQYPYHAHLQRQQQYNNSNYMCKFTVSCTH
ncbi:unnamed protein product [Rotaria socialis]|uniref:Uncharacterized protein n=1 Tax=Rotaria socialis TaxID=392032 RepID=A0A819Y5C0_9BILA|nr:unnamed protein product [Rotaria socialis]